MKGGILMHLKDISGYWEHSYNSHCHLYKGTIMVQQDGWFEGFIKEQNLTTEKNEIGFVFGVYVPSKLIELFYCRGDFISRFRCENDAHNYRGTYSSIGPYMEIPGGECKITLESPTYSEEEVISKTNICKSLIGDRGHIFYNHILANKSKLIVLQCYHNCKLEKISDILEMPNEKSKYEKMLKYYK